jgi:hypothetical protein
MWRMMLSPILSAALGLACVMSASPSRAAVASDDRNSSSAPANTHSAAAGAAPVPDPRIKSKRTGDLQSPRTGARESSGWKGQNSATQGPHRASETPQRGIHQGASGSGNRAHSLMNPQAQGRLARPTSDPGGLNRAGSAGPGLRRPGNVGAASAPTFAASKRNALPVPNLTPFPRNSAIGGPRVQSGGRLGVTGVGRTSHGAVIDGTQFHPKF